MSGPKFTVHDWLDKANEDMNAVEAMIGIPIVSGSIMGFHCQQAAEKALKGYLVFKGSTPERTHNLRRINIKCIRHDAEFAILNPDCRLLSPLAVVLRYPSPSREPTEKDRVDFHDAAKTYH